MTHAEELHRRMQFAHPPYAVLDVRSVTEHQRACIPGSLSASLQSLDAGLPAGTTTGTEFIVVGRDLTDATTRSVTEKLRSLGVRRVVELPGGLKEWQAAGFDLNEPGALSGA